MTEFWPSLLTLPTTLLPFIGYQHDASSKLAARSIWLLVSHAMTADVVVDYTKGLLSRGHEHGGNDMSHVRRFDHVGITVTDLDVATQFFVSFGLKIEGRTFVEGEFIDTVTGIPGSRTEIVMLRPPDNGTRVELSSFVRPDCVPGSPTAMANEVGLRSLGFEVDDLDAAVDQVTSAGYGLVGGIGEYEGSWRMAYVRGPEGIIVALAQPIG
ncbi:MAG TPA: VOC family protein [Aeromicrobium sp.]|nr:VOC family protein [Aeromicrobium sp.]